MPIIRSNLPANVDHKNAPVIPVEYMVTEPQAVVVKQPPRVFQKTVDAEPTRAEEPQEVDFKNFPRIGGLGI